MNLFLTLPPDREGRPKGQTEFRDYALTDFARLFTQIPVLTVLEKINPVYCAEVQQAYTRRMTNAPRIPCARRSIKRKELWTKRAQQNVYEDACQYLQCTISDAYQFLQVDS